MNGDKETGVTIMRMVAKMDAGAIISQRAIQLLVKMTLQVCLKN